MTIAENKKVLCKSWRYGKQVIQ